MSESTKLTNAQFAESNDFFRECCAAAEIPATARQASKYRRRRGVAYRKRNAVIAARKAREQEEASNA